MKIQRILIKNFKGISHFEAKGLKDFIVIAGPNGCGKSTIFDAIRLLKSYYGSYGNDETDMFWNEFQLKRGTQVNIKPLFRDANQPIHIEIDFEFTDEEKEYMRSNARSFNELDLIRQHNKIPYSKPASSINYTISIDEKDNFSKLVDEATSQFIILVGLKKHNAMIEIDPNGSVKFRNDKVIHFALSSFEPNKIGIIDLIGANRTFNKVSSTNINVNFSNNFENYKNSSLYNTANKYSQIKQELAASYLKSLLLEKKGMNNEGKNLEESMQSLFSKFFPNKTFLTPLVQQDGIISFNVQISDGSIHDIDELSLGEKEIVMGYLRLHNLNVKNSILLFDEPELHLNPRLIRELPIFYKNELGKGKNQTWLITHSDALLKEVARYEDSSVYHMLPAYQCIPESQQLHRISSEDNIELAILNLVGDMSQYSPASDILFLEGENSEFDKELVLKLFPEIAGKFNIISGTSKRKVYLFAELYTQILEERGDKTRVYCIVDRDRGFDLQSSMEKLSWNAYHIENYLLNPEIIYDVLNSAGFNNKFNSIEDVENSLKSWAYDCIPKLIVDNFQDYLNSKIVSKINIGINPNEDDIAAAFRKNILHNLEKLQGLERDFQESFFQSEISQIKNELEKKFNESWENECIGRKVLKKLTSQLPGLNYEVLKNLIISKMVERGYKPQGMHKVLHQIYPEI